MMLVLALLGAGWIGAALGFFTASLLATGKIAQMEAALERLRSDLATERIRGWLDSLEPDE